MPKVAVYTRATTGGSRRRYVKATRGSTGPFFLRYEINGKRVWEGLGTRTYTFALADARSKESSLLREEATPPKPSPAAPKSVEELRTAFIHDKKTTFKKDGTPLDPDTISSYEKVTREFLDTIKRSQPAQITKQDLKDWMVKQRERVSHRTVCNLYISIACFLHFCGVDHKKLLPQSERPSPVEETPEAYTEEEMTKFFFVITKERDALAFELMLKTGPREQELANLEWEHLDLGKTPTVSYKTRDNFRTKTGKSRSIPLERGLADRLAEWRVKNPTSLLLFPTEQGKVEGHFLRLCKEYANRDGSAQDEEGEDVEDEGCSPLQDLADEDYVRLRPATDGTFGFNSRSIRGGQVYPCRITHYSGALPREFALMGVLARTVAEAFKQSWIRDRWEVQFEKASQTPAWLLRTSEGVTPFTTITCNRTWRTAAHIDKGDLKEGFGVLCCLGDFGGCHLVFPRHRVAVNYQEGDVLLANVHEVHGNSPLLNPDGSVPVSGNEPERLVCVFYYQEQMEQCEINMEKEHKFINSRKRGDAMKKAKAKGAGK